MGLWFNLAEVGPEGCFGWFGLLSQVRNSAVTGLEKISILEIESWLDYTYGRAYVARKFHRIRSLHFVWHVPLNLQKINIFLAKTSILSTCFDFRCISGLCQKEFHENTNQNESYIRSKFFCKNHGNFTGITSLKRRVPVEKTFSKGTLSVILTFSVWKQCFGAKSDKSVKWINIQDLPGKFAVYKSV